MFKLIENPSCPTCGNSLLKVRQSSDSMLNAEQFAAVKAGDWYCETCPSNERGNTRYKYYWNRELGIEEGD